MCQKSPRKWNWVHTFNSSTKLCENSSNQCSHESYFRDILRTRLATDVSNTVLESSGHLLHIMTLMYLWEMSSLGGYLRKTQNTWQLPAFQHEVMTLWGAFVNRLSWHLYDGSFVLTQDDLISYCLGDKRYRCLTIYLEMNIPS